MHGYLLQKLLPYIFPLNLHVEERTGKEGVEKMGINVKNTRQNGERIKTTFVVHLVTGHTWELHVPGKITAIPKETGLRQGTRATKVTTTNLDIPGFTRHSDEEIHFAIGN